MENSRIQRQQVPQENSQKMQQNSYPFYVPTVRSKGIPEQNLGEIIQRPASNLGNQTIAQQQYPPIVKKNSNIIGKQGLNNTFSNYIQNPPPPYRRS